MRRYLALFLPAFSLTLLALPIAMMLDHLGRGATVIRALAVLPLWIVYAALFALPFVAVAAGLALLLQLALGEWSQRGAGRALFVVACGAFGAALVSLLFPSFALIAAAAGGVAAWVASTPAPLRWATPILLGAGLAVGIVTGLQFY